MCFVFFGKRMEYIVYNQEEENYYAKKKRRKAAMSRWPTLDYNKLLYHKPSEQEMSILREVIINVLNETGSIDDAALHLDVSKRTLWNKIRLLNIECRKIWYDPFKVDYQIE